MGRRKKEPPGAHRAAIAKAAERLFAQKGMEATSMDEIAKAAGYSKATLYVYFQSKEELVGLLVLESMQKLHRCLCRALEQPNSIRAKYDLLCRALVQYQQEFPFYFGLVLRQINIDFDAGACLPEEVETFQVGERINGAIRSFLEQGMAEGALRPGLCIVPTIFAFWGMLAGLVQTASNKEAYILREMKQTKAEFLQYGFDLLYRSIQSGKEQP